MWCYLIINNYWNIKELKKYVGVDVYGACGDKKCPEKFRNGTLTSDCRAILADEYKFYLAFENSLCRDYITEKFFSVLELDTVPVVHGNGQYDQYVSTLRLWYVFLTIRTLFSSLNRYTASLYFGKIIDQILIFWR